jgi:hypothetical protein
MFTNPGDRMNTTRSTWLVHFDISQVQAAIPESAEAASAPGDATLVDVGFNRGRDLALRVSLMTRT